jgi:hypothetical protein
VLDVVFLLRYGMLTKGNFMHTLTLETSLWNNAKIRYGLNHNDFDETIIGTNTVVVFSSLQSCSNVFTKIAIENLKISQENFEIMKAYEEIVAKTV